MSGFGRFTSVVTGEMRPKISAIQILGYNLL